MQSVDAKKQFRVGGKYVLVFGDDVGLNFFRTSPQVTAAERAWLPFPVYVFQVPFDVLGTCEAFVASYTRMLLHTRAAARAASGTFTAAGSSNNFMPPCSVRLRLGYVSMQSDRETQWWVLASKEATLGCAPNVEIGNASVIAWVW